MGAASRGAPPLEVFQLCKKIGYVSRRNAQMALKAIGHSGAGGLRVYRCNLCPGEIWHLGHNRDKAKNAMVRSAHKL